MELEIQKQKETPLLARTRINIIARYDKETPSIVNLRKEVALKLKADENLVIIRHIYTKYGKRESKIIAHVYKDQKLMEKLEGERLVCKNKGIKMEKKVKAAPKAEEKK
ncbi:hypothetical protein HY636_05255 [Candidatus Woesearchaeota archaeon]|nr:hypothetical protein [Candidatus Woesearchaeota archaeon]